MHLLKCLLDLVHLKHLSLWRVGIAAAKTDFDWQLIKCPNLESLSCRVNDPSHFAQLQTTDFTTFSHNNHFDQSVCLCIQCQIHFLKISAFQLFQEQRNL